MKTIINYVGCAVIGIASSVSGYPIYDFTARKFHFWTLIALVVLATGWALFLDFIYDYRRNCETRRALGQFKGNTNPYRED